MRRVNDPEAQGFCLHHKRACRKPLPTGFQGYREGPDRRGFGYNTGAHVLGLQGAGSSCVALHKGVVSSTNHETFLPVLSSGRKMAAGAFEGQT